jgi:acetylornithine deacetylase
VAEEVTGSAPRVAGAPFACDAFMFNHSSPTPALLYGPRGGDAHATDEYVELDDFLRLVETFALFAARWAGRAGEESQGGETA